MSTTTVATTVKGYAVTEAGGSLQAHEYQLGELAAREVDIDVQYCGICHSDLSVIDNEWGNAEYPVIPGHEVIGTVRALGSEVSHLSLGQTVGLGWYASSCMHCQQCMQGDHNLCGTATATILGRHGGFANRVRASAEWVIALPDGVEPSTAGPLFCGGITVFNPIVQLDIKPTDRVGVIGIGGLGHLAIQFLDAWGCHVTAFSSSPDKEEEARRLGADDFIASAEPKALKPHAGKFDAIISTVNVPLHWDAYVQALAPKGRLHTVGAVLEPFGVSNGFMLIGGQKSVSGSPLGSPANTRLMLDFCARHDISAQTEVFKLANVNQAVDKLRNGRPRYRLVLDCRDSQ